VGVASERSIAAGIADAFAREGCEIAFTYQNEKLLNRVKKLSSKLGQNTNLIFPCDVTSDSEIDTVFKELNRYWSGLDIIVHSVGFAPREQLAGGFVESITREGFSISHDISAYSLAALAKAGLPMMEGRNGSILTLTYNAALRVVPNYNVMGLAKASLESCVRFLAADLGEKNIRVNAISAGAVKTLAAAGISGFRKMLSYAEKASPLHRTVSIEEIGNTAAFLCSDLASGITGETTFVDAGANIMGMIFEDD
jgi:enoyl-[acyl-carrier protein] reductase I